MNLTNLVCFGDSLTEVSSESEDRRWPTLVQSKLEAIHPLRFQVFNCGVSGNTTAGALDRIDEVLPLMPGWVLVAFGVNDCNVRKNRHTPRVGLPQFETNLHEIVRMFEARGGKIILLATHTPAKGLLSEENPYRYEQGNQRSYAENFRPYEAAIRRVAKALKLPLFSMDEILSEDEVVDSAMFIEDGLHLSTLGNHIYAEVLVSRLLSVILSGSQIDLSS